MLDRALSSRPDAYVPDMEDSVPDSEKVNARLEIQSHLKRLRAAGPMLLPRVNGLDTDLTQDDLAAVVGPEIDGVSIGKIESADDIRRVCNMIMDLEKKAGLETGKLVLIPWIETAAAVQQCYDICQASHRVTAVAFGAEDFTHDMGIERSPDESEVAVARSLVCIAARAANVLALDTPYFQFKDQDGLRRNAAAAKKMGFKGKFAIHPAQVDPLNEAFSPTPSEVEYARRVVAAFEAAEGSGRGSTSLDGHVIDVPVVKRAQAVLELVNSNN